MNAGMTLPVVTGICAGVAMIAIFALFIHHGLSLSIQGLKSSYRIGEQMTFTLRVSGYGYYCQTPGAAIWNASSAFDSSVPVWRSGLPSQLCPPYPKSHFIDDKYSWGEDRDITLDKPGDYVFKAGGDRVPTVQKEFKVTQ
jgi:hypothetical protein